MRAFEKRRLVREGCLTGVLCSLSPPRPSSREFLRQETGHRPKTSFNLTYAFGADAELPAHLCIRKILRATIKYLALPLC